MANTRGIRTHMKSVSNIQKITNAMQMVAAARLQKAKTKAISSKPYADRIKRMMLQAVSDKTMLAGLDLTKNPLLEERTVYKTCYIVIGSDKGLAGPYNANLIKHVNVELLGKKNFTFITVGRQIKNYFRKSGYEIKAAYTGFSDKPSYEAADEITNVAEKLFTSGAVDEVIVIYTHFKSALVLTPMAQRLLPVKPEAESTLQADKKKPDVMDFSLGNKFDFAPDTPETSGDDEDNFTDIIFEPPAGEMLKYLAHYYIRTLVYMALMQGAACELSARMTAMSSATDNANSLLNKLSVHYNKARQANITNEINEIVSGAEALQ